VTTPDPSADADLFDVLSAISIIGPDNDDVLWVSFKNEDELGAVAVRADTIAGHAVSKWRDKQSAALAKAVLVRATQAEK
jgi:hypothetical protein